MSIGSTISRVRYVGAGTTDTFSFTFKIFAATDLVVTKRNSSTGDETTLSYPTDYTVTGVGLSTGGSITLTAGNLASGYSLHIRRVRPLTQGTAIRNEGTYYASTHEDEFDNRAMIDQQQQDVLDRAVVLPETITTSNFDPVLPADLTVNGADRIPTLNASADGWAAVTDWPTATEVANAQGYAQAASDSADDAAISATQAGNEATTASRWAKYTGGTVVDAVSGVDSGEYSAKYYAQVAQTNAAVVTGLGDPVTSTHGGTGQNMSASTGVVKVSAGTFSASAVDLNSSDVTGLLSKAKGGTGADNSSVTFPSSGTIVTEAGSATLTNKTLTAPVISTISNTGTLTLPTSTDTLVGKATTDTLTNKTINGANNTITNVSLSTGVTGTLPIANGGTGQITANAALNALLPSQTSNSGKYLTTNGTDSSWASLPGSTLPTIQTFTSGSGTYTTPANCRYIKIKMVGGGGGGSGSATSAGNGGGGGNGGATTFGSSLLIANGGTGAAGAGLASGAGGSTTVNSPAIGKGWTGAQGNTGNQSGGSYVNGGSGGSSFFGGAGYGAVAQGTGGTAQANTGSGGGGAGGPASASAQSGGGGGAGGFIEAIITSPSSTYSYAVGSSGSAGSAGTSGAAGGAGAAGIIIVEEYY